MRTGGALGGIAGMLMTMTQQSTEGGKRGRSKRASPQRRSWGRGPGLPCVSFSEKQRDLPFGSTGRRMEADPGRVLDFLKINL